MHPAPAITEDQPAAAESLWSRPSGVREVLSIALPMVASTLSWTLMSFIDSSILYHVSEKAMTAAFSASVFWFAALSFFWGICSYTSTFVSQYHGDDQPERIGPAVWQGVFLALMFAPLALAAMPLGRYFFQSHAPDMAALETRFFQLLCLGAPGMLAAQSLEGFFSGRGRTWIVMCVDAGAVVINLVLALVLVLGWGGVTPLGIDGAAYATVIAQWSRAAIYMAVFLSSGNRRAYNTLGGARLDATLFKRLIRFGGPSGVQMVLDVGGFTYFVQKIGQLTLVDFAATSLVFRVSHLAFMPVWGLGIATTVLVGQRLGESRPDLARRAVGTTYLLGLCYMGTISALFVLAPDVLLQFFKPDTAEAAANSVAIHDLAVQLMMFVAAYNLFDATLIIFSSVLRGAGDTKFIMRLSMASAALLIAATWLAVDVFKGNVYVCWSIITGWVWLLAATYIVRYRQGRWQSMRVIEQTHHDGGAIPDESGTTPSAEQEPPRGELAPAAYETN
jgi:MATE family multidrug resistance protein